MNDFTPDTLRVGTTPTPPPGRPTGRIGQEGRKDLE